MIGKRIWITEDDSNRRGEASGVAKMLGNKCRCSGTDTTLTGIGTPEKEINSGQAVLVLL